MTRRLIHGLVLVLLVGALGACTRIDYAAGPNKPVLANRALVRPHRVTSNFEDRGRRFYALWGLVPIGGANGEDLISRRAAQGDGLVNVNACERYNLVDMLIDLATVGLISSRTVDVKGSVFVFEPSAPDATIIIVPPAAPAAPANPSQGGI